MKSIKVWTRAMKRLERPNRVSSMEQCSKTHLLHESLVWIMKDCTEGELK